jgi:WD40-like Beta Propeller Repeat
MPARGRVNRTAIALTATLTAGTAALLTGCGPTQPGSTATAASGAASATSTGAPGTPGRPAAATAKTPAAGAAPAASATAAPAPAGVPAVNGAVRGGLTVSNGSRYVLINGVTVDFGTPVRDLAWSPDGRRAAFIDGAGDLAVAGPDGSRRVVVARNPGGQTWSHPTWQVAATDTADQLPAKNNLLFAADAGGVSRLDIIKATAVDGTPKAASLNHEADEGVPALPQTGNVWPSAGGTHGTSVYANSRTGEVYIRDDYLRQQGIALAPGSEPAMSPRDDEEIVFVRSVGGHDHLFLEKSTDKGPSFKDLTPKAATDYTEPAWSPDGRTLAARTAQGIVTLPADGSAAPVVVSTRSGLPAYRD